MRSKKPTLFQQAIKEIKRLEKATRRAAKRGYTFDLPFRKTKTGKEKTRFTQKEVEYLKSLKLRDLYEYSTYEGRSGVERRAEERREASLKAARTRQEKRKERENKYKQNPENYGTPRPTSYPSISYTIINAFLSRSEFKKLNLGVDPVEEESAYQYVVDFCNKVIDDPEVGANGLADALENARVSGLYQEIHLSYWWQIMGKMDKLLPYLPKRYESDINAMSDFTSNVQDGGMNFREKNQLFIELFGEE